ncbi:hypothetical protein Tco_0598498 [Tanacetum coccineum]
MQNTMAEQNVPAQAPTRTDEQIVPRSQWLQIGKSNNSFSFARDYRRYHIFQISVDILRNPILLQSVLCSLLVSGRFIQQLGYSMIFFTSAQDGDPLQDDVRLCLGDDLKKAQDHYLRQVKDESKDHYPKSIAIEKGPCVIPPTALQAT